MYEFLKARQALCHVFQRRFCESISSNSKPVIICNPQAALVDVPVHIKVANLLENQPISISSHVTNDGGRPFCALAHYTSDADGLVDLAEHSSIGGDYSGVEPMGLLWAAKIPVYAEKTYSRLSKNDVTTPHVVTLSVFDGHVCEKDIWSANPIATTAVERWYSSGNIKRILVDVGRLHGVMFVPEASGSYPAVIDLRGGGGTILEGRAALLASHGFVTFALAYKGAAAGPGSPEMNPIDLHYFEEAVQYLLSNKKVHGDEVGIVGTSTGGIIGCTMAGRMPGIACVVAINSAVFTMHAGLTYKSDVWRPLFWEKNFIEVKDGVCYLLNSLKMPSYEQLKEKIVPFSEAKAPILFVCGGDDATLPMDKMCEIVEKKMKSTGKTNYQILYYPGAGHLIELPYSPHTSVTYYSKGFTAPVLFGGKTRDHAMAQVDSWKKILEFLKTNLPNYSES